MTQTSLRTVSSNNHLATASTAEDIRLLYQLTREYSEYLCTELNDEDIQAQSMPDASPLKWHLAHTSWAFETFLLKPHLGNYQAFNSDFEYLFNSYYNAVGAQFPRPQRGLLTRPDRQEVLAYRRYVDKAMNQLLENDKALDTNEALLSLTLLLINHEQQHQELMLTDLKHLFFFNPIAPKPQSLSKLSEDKLSHTNTRQTVDFDSGLYSIGHQDEAFYFDNEGPRHKVYLEPFKLDSTLITNEEYLEFVDSSGYQAAEFWLSEAWYQICENKSAHPLYWRQIGGEWFEHSFNGVIPLELAQPVKHINYFEASAFASWKNKRLPTEQEWEVAAKSDNPKFSQLFNELWQWTSSAYNAYPGFKPVPGAIGEYNGKFMVNQYVLRGGSVATPAGHIRPSYRNFFYPGASWQFTGIRLAETI